MKTYEHIGNGTVLVTDDQIKYVQFDCFDKYDELIHGMSTRSLNLGFKRNYKKENIMKNFQIICKSLDIDCNSMVFSNQIHESSLKIVSESDKGKGFSRPNDINGFDGLITNTRGITLVTFYADCVPLFFYDTNNKVAALSHSGWKSTLENIAVKTVKKMQSEFGCNPKNIITAIGPSIGSCCFEVGSDVYIKFSNKYENVEYYEIIEESKWKINLQGIIKNELEKIGLLNNNIYWSNICTKCRTDLFFSHRGDSGNTGSMAAFIQIK